jgi:hypothetical protein
VHPKDLRHGPIYRLIRSISPVQASRLETRTVLPSGRTDLEGTAPWYELWDRHGRLREIVLADTAFKFTLRGTGKYRPTLARKAYAVHIAGVSWDDIYAMLAPEQAQYEELLTRLWFERLSPTRIAQRSSQFRSAAKNAAVVLCVRPDRISALMQTVLTDNEIRTATYRYGPRTFVRLIRELRLGTTHRKELVQAEIEFANSLSCRALA